MKKNTTANNLKEEAIVDYLATHLDFFQRHPTLLKQIEIPHEHGDGTISLVEQQIKLLRKENQEIRDELLKFIDIAKQNQALVNQVYTLFLTLLKVKPKNFFTTLYKELEKKFNTKNTQARLFLDPSKKNSETEFVGVAHKDKALFGDIINQKMTLIAKLNEPQKLFLFGHEIEPLDAFIILIPLQGKDWNGLLAINSRTPERINPDMKTTILNYLGEFISVIIETRIK